MHRTLIRNQTKLTGIQDLKTISMYSSLPELGMDSINGMEIKQALEQQHDIFLSPQEIISLTFAQLQEMQRSGKKGNGKPRPWTTKKRITQWFCVRIQFHVQQLWTTTRWPLCLLWEAPSWPTPSRLICQTWNLLLRSLHYRKILQDQQTKLCSCFLQLTVCLDFLNRTYSIFNS